jgi:hypothetical protein
MNQKTPCLQMLSWKLHVRMSMSPRKLPFSVYYTKYPEQKWRRSIAKDVDFFNFRRRNTRKLQVLGSANNGGFRLCIIYPNYLSCFKVVPEPGQRNSFSKRLFVPQNTAFNIALGTVQYLLKGRAGGKQGRARTFFSRLKGRAFTFLCNN